MSTTESHSRVKPRSAVVHKSALSGRPIVPLRALATPNPNTAWQQQQQQTTTTASSSPKKPLSRTSSRHHPSSSSKLDPPSPDKCLVSADPLVAERERRAKHARLSMAREPAPSSHGGPGSKQPRRGSANNSEQRQQQQQPDLTFSSFSASFSPERRREHQSGGSGSGRFGSTKRDLGRSGSMSGRPPQLQSPTASAFALDASPPRMYPAMLPHHSHLIDTFGSGPSSHSSSGSSSSSSSSSSKLAVRPDTPDTGAGAFRRIR